MENMIKSVSRAKQVGYLISGGVFLYGTWTMFRRLVNAAQRTNDTEKLTRIKQCRSGCVNIGYKDGTTVKLYGSGFFIE